MNFPSFSKVFFPFSSPKTCARPGASVFDLGFGSGVMTAMLLAAAPSSGVRVIGVDLEDKVKVATETLGICGNLWDLVEKASCNDCELDNASHHGTLTSLIFFWRF